jgi:hypothetical protein
VTTNVWGASKSFLVLFFKKVLVPRQLGLPADPSSNYRHVGSFRGVFRQQIESTLRIRYARRRTVTYDDPFILHMNIARLKSMIGAGINDTVRQTVRQILKEFEDAAVILSAARAPLELTKNSSPEALHPPHFLLCSVVSMEANMKLNQNELNKMWEVATTVGEVEGWSADDQGDIHLLEPTDREQHGHYEREAPDGEWKAISGVGAA